MSAFAVDPEPRSSPPSGFDEVVSPARNSYSTNLSPDEEGKFQSWVKQNKIPWQDSPTADYDMRGYWKAQQSGDSGAKQGANGHFPDTYKTPFHKTFSNESIYATPDAPHWDGSKLIDDKGNVVADESAPDRSSAPAGFSEKVSAPQRTSAPEGFTEQVASSPQDSAASELAKSGLPPAAVPAPLVPPGLQAHPDYRETYLTPGQINAADEKHSQFAEQNPEYSAELERQSAADQINMRAAREHPIAAGLEAVLPGTGEAAIGAEQLATGKPVTQGAPGGRTFGALHAIAGLTNAATPLIGPAAIENPVGVFKGLASGAAASYGTGKAADALGVQPETKELAQQAAFFVPGIVSSLSGAPYRALPGEPLARSAELFKNLTYKGGAELPDNPTAEQASSAYKAAISNLHPDVNPLTAEEAQNLTSAWNDLKQANYFSKSPTVSATEPAVPRFLRSSQQAPEGFTEPVKAPAPVEQAPAPEVAEPSTTAPVVNEFLRGGRRTKSAEEQAVQDNAAAMSAATAPKPTPAAPVPLESAPFVSKAVSDYKAIAANPAEAEKAYDALPASNGGRIVAADTAKELLPQWTDVGARAELDEAIHPDASKLAYQIFQSKLDQLPRGSEVELVTGPVAAGKSSGAKDSQAALTYEVNLSDPEKASSHIDNILAHGDVPVIRYVYNTPAESARRRAMRMMRDGRPVSIDRSVAQHVQLPKTLEAMQAKYGNKLQVNVYDNSRRGQPPVKIPSSSVGSLAYTGGEDDLLRQQQAELDRGLGAGEFGPHIHRALSSKRAAGKAGQISGQPHPARGGPGEAGRSLETRPSASLRTASTSPYQQGSPVKTVLGNKTQIASADGSSIPAQYAWVSMDDVQPSHDLAFNKNPNGLPNERTYESSKEAQARLVEQRQNLRPRLVINTAPTMVDGPPAMFPDGKVPGGNSRAWAIKGAYADGTAERYRQAAFKHAADFGLKQRDGERISHPAIVRIVQPPATEEHVRRMVSGMNKAMTGALGVNERAVSAGKSIRPDTLRQISSMMDELGEDATLRSLMRERGKQLLELLLRDGVITDRERPQFVDTSNGGLSEEGKNFVERALLGSVVDDPGLMERVPKSVLNKLDGSLGDLAALSSRNDSYNILPLLRAALGEHAEIAAHGSTVDLHLNQSAMFGGARNGAVDALVRALNENPRKVKAAIHQFAQDASFDVPGQATLGLTQPPTPLEAFNNAFGTHLSPEAFSRDLKAVGMESPKAAAAPAQHEDLTPWATSRSLKITEAGEQPTLFGEPEKMYYLEREADGKPDRVMVSESELRHLEGEFPNVKKAITASQQSGLFKPADLGEIVGSGSKASGIELPPQKKDLGLFARYRTPAGTEFETHEGGEPEKPAFFRAISGGLPKTKVERLPESENAPAKPPVTEQEASPVAQGSQGKLFRGDSQSTFYSKAERVAEQKLPNSGDGNAFLRTLENNGVKPEEIKWIGLDDFLKGKGKVSKQEVMEFIRQNNVRVEEVTKGEPSLKAISTNQELGAVAQQIDRLRVLAFGADTPQDEWTFGERQQARERAIASAESPGNQDTRWINSLRISPERKSALLEYGRAAVRSRELNNEALRAASRENTKFSAHQLPGGKNYRELLLTLPETKPSSEAAKTPLIEEARRIGNEWATLSNKANVELARTKPQEHKAALARMYEIEKRQDAIQKELQSLSKSDTAFRSSHFDEPNVLAHVRFNDRTDAEGKKVLFLEEVQSDWHQRGRKYGYDQGTREKFNQVKDEVQKKYGVDNLIDLRAQATKSPELQADLKRVDEAYAAYQNDEHAQHPRVPDAPFKTSWQELSLKRMLRYAAENGYDKLAWTPGEIQNDRYDLSKHVDAVAYFPETNRLQAMKGGSIVIDKEVPQAQLADYIGKDAAEKLVRSPIVREYEGRGLPHYKLEGQDLKVGGSGMKGFYDKIIPEFLNKYAKKWGARVGETNIGTGNLGKQISDGAGGLVREGTGVPKREAVPSLHITPSMKQSVMNEGQPLFRGSEELNAAMRKREVDIVENMKFSEHKPASGLSHYVMVDNLARQVIGRALQQSLRGIVLEKADAQDLVKKVRGFAEQVRPVTEKGAQNMTRFADTLQRMTDPKRGLVIVAEGENGKPDFSALHEEQVHSVTQVLLGKGSFVRGIPHEEMRGDSGFETLAKRIRSEYLGKASWPIIVAEGVNDLLSGTAEQLSPEQQEASATHYFEEVAKKHGVGAVEKSERLERYFDREQVSSGIMTQEQRDAIPGRQALKAVIARLRQRGAAEIAQPVHGSDQRAGARRRAGRGTEEGGSGGGEEPLTQREPSALAKHPLRSLFQRATPPAPPKPPSNRPAAAGGEPPSGPPTALEPLKELLSDKLTRSRQARELQEGIYDLESQNAADALRAVQLLRQLPGTAADYESIYHWKENPSLKLSPEQRSVYEQYLEPIDKQSQQIYRKLTQGGMPVENYVHRVVRDRGNFLDRVISGKMASGGGGNVLSKSASATKSRTMMALEDETGKRQLVAIKGGRVSAIHQGRSSVDIGPYGAGLVKPEPEAPLLAGEASAPKLDTLWRDKLGKTWKLKQATTKEIEGSTNLRYYHNAAASSLSSYLALRRAERAYDFVDDLKRSKQFGEIAQPIGTGNPPEGWKPTQLTVQGLNQFYFEPHTREVLDWFAQRMHKDPAGLMEAVGRFLRTSIFFNPLIHIPNVAVHWGVERGVGGYLPGRQYVTTWNAGVKAINAVWHQNQDYLRALDEGAPLQSHREDVRQLSKLLFEKMAKELEQNPSTAAKVGKALGYANPAKLIKAIYDFSGKATWLVNDVAFMQSTYEKTARGMSLKDALTETGKHIPTYRLPTRIMGSRDLGKLMSNPLMSMFGAYHYGALRSYGEMMKSALGSSGKGTGRSSAQESAHGFNLLAMLGLFTVAIYPLLDKLAKKVSGDARAEFRRAGASTLPYNLYLLAKGERSPTEVLQSIITPAVGVKDALELAFNREFRSGRKIYDPHAKASTIARQVAGKALGTVSPIDQAMRIKQDRSQWAKFVYGLIGVRFPMHGAEKLASDIALDNIPVAAQSPAAREKSIAVRTAIDEARKGNTGPLRRAMQSGGISRADVAKVLKSAAEDPLAEKVKNFSYEQFMTVWRAATPEEKKRLEPTFRHKAALMISKGRGAELARAGGQ